MACLFSMNKSFPICLGFFSSLGPDQLFTVLFIVQFPVIFYISFDFFPSFLNAKVTADKQLYTSFSETNALDL